MSIWKNKKFVSLVILHSGFAAVSIALALISKVYADQFVGPAIPDLILDHVPRIDTSFFFYQGAFILVTVIIVTVFSVPQYIPFVLASVALFYLIRSCLMVTTHLPAAYAPSGNDLFFSGHTGLPFLMALVFWRYAILRYFFVFASVVAGISVLLSHVHYTIDVLAAYFITYSIYKICVRIFHIEHGYLRS